MTLKRSLSRFIGAADSTDISLSAGLRLSPRHDIFGINCSPYGTGGGYTTATVSGTSPLSLPNAKANSLSSLKAFGGCSQASTPTPDTPVDIVCNNGVLKLSPNITNYGDSTWKDGYFTTNGSIGGANYEQGEMYCETYYPVSEGEQYTISFCYSGDTLPSNTWACFAFYDSSKNFLSRTANSASIAANPKAYTTTIQSGTAYIRISLRTYKNSGNAVYNVQLEKGSSATTYHPYGVYADGTVETISVLGKNLFNYDQEPTVESVSSDGVWQRYNVATDLSVGNWYAKHITNVQPGTYIASIYTENGLVSFNNIFVYNGSTATRYSNGSVITITTPSEIWFMGGSASTWTTITKVQVESGSTITDWVDYFNGGTATCENLLSVGTYTDEQEVISGGVTRKVGVKVLDGTEDWSSRTVGNNQQIFGLTFSDISSDDDATVVCSNFKAHIRGDVLANIADGEVKINSTNSVVYFRYDSVADLAAWKSWLANQYAAGTPIIVIYPLATATTETVTGQTMNVKSGSNTVEITQASMTGLELEATYKKAA